MSETMLSSGRSAVHHAWKQMVSREIGIIGTSAGVIVAASPSKDLETRLLSTFKTMYEVIQKVWDCERLCFGGPAYPPLG